MNAAEVSRSGSLQRLLAWTSPSLPVGAYAYSHGIEAAVEAGLIGSASDLRAWLAQTLARGSGLIDAALLVHAFRAERAGDDNLLLEIAELAAAMRATSEATLESTAQGAALVDALQAGWPQPRLEYFAQRLRARTCPPSYAAVLGVAFAATAVNEADAVTAMLHGVTASLVSAGVRLIPLGQRQGVWVLADLEPTIASTAARARNTALCDLGSSTWRVDWAMARHEIQFTRLFRS